MPDEAGVFACLEQLLPGPALEGPVETNLLFAAHLPAFELTLGAATADPRAVIRRRAVRRVLGEKNLLPMLEAYASSVELLEEEEHHEVATRILEPIGRVDDDIEERAEAVAALLRLVRIVAANHTALPLDVVSRTLGAWQAVSGMRTGTWEETSWLAPTDTPPIAPDWLATRAALELSRNDPGHPLPSDHDTAKQAKPAVARSLTHVLASTGPDPLRLRASARKSSGRTATTPQTPRRPK